MAPNILGVAGFITGVLANVIGLEAPKGGKDEAISPNISREESCELLPLGENGLSDAILNGLSEAEEDDWRTVELGVALPLPPWTSFSKSFREVVVPLAAAVGSALLAKFFV